MRRTSVGAICQNCGFEAAEVKIAAETRDCVGRKRNPIAISVFIPSFSDVP